MALFAPSSGRAGPLGVLEFIHVRLVIFFLFFSGDISLEFRANASGRIAHVWEILFARVKRNRVVHGEYAKLRRDRSDTPSLSASSQHANDSEVRVCQRQGTSNSLSEGGTTEEELSWTETPGGNALQKSWRAGCTWPQSAIPDSVSWRAFERSGLFHFAAARQTASDRLRR